MAALLVAAVVAGCFFPWWTRGRVLAPLDIVRELLLPWRSAEGIPRVHNHFVSDAVTQYLPYRWQLRRSIREDGYIGWTDLTLGGYPLHANTMATPYDWTIQLERWMDFWTAWHLGIAVQMLIAGFGMLALLRGRGLAPPAAFAGAVAFMLNFQFVAWVYHRWALGSFCWAPWMLWGLMRHRCGCARGGAAAAFFLALGCLGGSLQHAVFLLLVVGCCAVAWFWEDQKASRTPQQRPAWAVTGVVVLGLGLVTPILWNFTQAYFLGRQLGDARGGLGYPQGPLQPILNLLAYPFYTFPFPFGSPNGLDGWKLFKSDLFNLPYFGVVPTALGFAALRMRRVATEARVLVAIGLLIPLTPLVGPLYHRAHLLFILGGCWAFALWLDERVRRPELPVISRPLLWLGVAVIVGWSAVSVGLVVFDDGLRARFVSVCVRLGGEGQFGGLEAWLRERAGRAWDQLSLWHPRNALPLGAAAAGLAAVYWTRWRPACAWWVGALLAVELGAFGCRWVSFQVPEPEGLYPRTPLVEQLQRSGGTVHTFIEGSSRMPFPPNTLSTFGIRALPGYESIRPPMLLDRSGGWSAAPAALPEIGVSHLLQRSDAPPPPPPWAWLGEERSVRLYENPLAIPHYRVVRPSGIPDAPVELVSASLNRRILRLPGGGGELRVAENAAPGWKGRWEGGPWMDSTPGSHGEISVPLANGTGSFEMRYFTPWRPGSLAISAAAFCVLAWQMRRRGSGAESVKREG